MENKVNHIKAINFINPFIHNKANETQKIGQNRKNVTSILSDVFWWLNLI